MTEALVAREHASTRVKWSINLGRRSSFERRKSAQLTSIDDDSGMLAATLVQAVRESSEIFSPPAFTHQVSLSNEYSVEEDEFEDDTFDDGRSQTRPSQTRLSKLSQPPRTSILESMAAFSSSTARQKAPVMQVSESGVPLNPGSLYNFIEAHRIDSSCASAREASDIIPAPPQPPPNAPISPPSCASTPAASMGVRSPRGPAARRRTRFVGDRLADWHATSRGSRLAARSAVSPSPPSHSARAAHPLPFGSPLAAPGSPDAWLHDNGYAPLLGERSDSRTMIPRAPSAAHGDHHALTPAPEVLSEDTAFNVAMFSNGGQSARKYQQTLQTTHPVLACLAGMNRDKGAQDEEETTHTHRPQESGLDGKLSLRLDRQRWKERRNGRDWTIEPEPLPKHAIRGEKQAAGVELTGQTVKQRKHLVELTAKQQAMNAVNDRHTHVAMNFKLLMWLMDPEKGSKVPPDAFVPLMFWLGLARHRKAVLSVFEMAFGGGSISKEKILELAPYFDTQMHVADGFKRQARKGSFDQLCEYVTNHENLGNWHKSMGPDTRGRIECGEIMKMIARMDVKENKKQLYRFIIHFAALYHQSHLSTQADAASETSHLWSHTKERLDPSESLQFDFPFLCMFLSRCVVTTCIVQVLDMVNPPSSKAGVANFSSLEAYNSAHGEPTSHGAAAEGDAVGRQVLRRWAMLHRRIAVSMLVNQRYWGRDGKMVLASMTQPTLPMFSNLTPDHWVGLYQRVRAQGMASTLPELDDDFEDTAFLSKRATCEMDYGK